MSGIYKDDSWVIGEASVNGLPLIIRTRSTLPSEPDRKTYEFLIIITWEYEANDNGMPDPGVNKSTIEFEDAVQAAIESVGVGVQAACITGNGKKEWRYYTYDLEKFMEAFNDGLYGHPVYPLNIQMFNDPDCSSLSELLPEN